MTSPTIWDSYWEHLQEKNKLPSPCQSSNIFICKGTRMNWLRVSLLTLITCWRYVSCSVAAHSTFIISSSTLSKRYQYRISIAISSCIVRSDYHTMNWSSHVCFYDSSSRLQMTPSSESSSPCSKTSILIGGSEAEICCYLATEASNLAIYSSVWNFMKEGFVDFKRCCQFKPLNWLNSKCLLRLRHLFMMPTQRAGKQNRHLVQDDMTSWGDVYRISISIPRCWQR